MASEERARRCLPEVRADFVFVGVGASACGNRVVVAAFPFLVAGDTARDDREVVTDARALGLFTPDSDDFSG